MSKLLGAELIGPNEHPTSAQLKERFIRQRQKAGRWLIAPISFTAGLVTGAAAAGLESLISLFPNTNTDILTGFESGTLAGTLACATVLIVSTNSISRSVAEEEWFPVNDLRSDAEQPQLEESKIPVLDLRSPSALEIMGE
ncbi:MAG TPA: hypothetical protein VLG47_00685 [Candidatus Saccharimonadales bacterium]|nr:hypothetical protein [Candidatus Saccharimonadales bacterium]